MEHLSIWIVEDDHLYQNMLTSYLSILGYKARCFNSGEECLQHLNEKIDVVLLDHNLGDGMKGVDVLRKIKQNNANTAVIYLSGEEKVSLVSDAYQHGLEEYITKDSASLIRLKLRLDKIAMAKAGHRKRARTKKFLMAGSLVFIILMVFCYLLLK